MRLYKIVVKMSENPQRESILLWPERDRIYHIASDAVEKVRTKCEELCNKPGVEHVSIEDVTQDGFTVL